MFKISEVEEFYNNVVLPRYGETQRADIDKELVQLRKSTRAKANKHLHTWIVLIDEGIHFLHFLGLLLLSRERKSPVSFTLVSLIAKLQSLAISFRELILLGQSDSSRLILRGFVETSDLALVALSDSEFCEKYFPDKVVDDKYDSNFWKNHIGYGKISEFVKVAMQKAGYENTEIENYITWKKNLKSNLSGAVHTDASSAQQSFAIPSLIKKGTLSCFSLGELSAYSPSLCTNFITDTLFFSGIFKGLISSSNMPSHLKGFTSGVEYASTIASCETLHEFFHRFSDELHIPFEELFPDEE